jgi:hypothetical protein
MALSQAAAAAGHAHAAEPTKRAEQTLGRSRAGLAQQHASPALLLSFILSLAIEHRA